MPALAGDDAFFLKASEETADGFFRDA